MLKTAAAVARLGTESAFEVLARAKQLEAQGRDIINLGIGQPDFQTPEHVVEAAVKALRDGHHGYTPANGIPALREAVAEDLDLRHRVSVDPDCIVVVPGGKVTMFFAVLMFGEPGAEILYPNPGFPIYESVIDFTGARAVVLVLRSRVGVDPGCVVWVPGGKGTFFLAVLMFGWPGAEILYPNPGFPIYESVIDFTGARAVPIPLREDNGFAFSAEEVLGLITPRTRLIILNSPANPTGGVTPRAEVDRLVEGLAAHPDITILSDEIYSQMLYDGRSEEPTSELQ